MKLVLLEPDSVISVEASRLVWLAMRDAIRQGPTDFAPDYFFGYSHACSLCHVISLDEWYLVRQELGDMRALMQT